MAGIEFKGLDQMRRDFEQLSARINGEIVRTAEDAAAGVFQSAISAAAPRKTGQLQQSVTIIQSKSRDLVASDRGRRGLFVGPEKRSGYYGYFIDRGFTAVGRAGRRQRAARGNMHSQSGTSGGRKIPGTRWFESAVNSAMDMARQAYEAAFFAGLNRGNK